MQGEGITGSPEGHSRPGPEVRKPITPLRGGNRAPRGGRRPWSQGRRGGARGQGTPLLLQQSSPGQWTEKGQGQA